MRLERQHLGEVERGDTFRRPITLESPWVLADFTGGIRCTVKASLEDDDPGAGQVSLTATADGSITFATTTEGTVRFNPSVTETWEPGRRYNWDVQGIVTGSPNDVFTLARGTFRVQADATRTATPQ
jgi:hypothetical protein